MEFSKTARGGHVLVRTHPTGGFGRDCGRVLHSATTTNVRSYAIITIAIAITITINQVDSIEMHTNNTRRLWPRVVV